MLTCHFLIGHFAPPNDTTVLSSFNERNIQLSQTDTR